MSEQAHSGCEVRYTTKGKPVRVSGSISQEALDQMGDAAEKLLADMCKALSDVPMPAIAQRIHGRETYWCGRPSGHDGLHRWPWPGDERADGGPRVADALGVWTR